MINVERVAVIGSVAFGCASTFLVGVPPWIAFMPLGFCVLLGGVSFVIARIWARRGW